tara:strand:+ start:33 stop:215 length:183 start_codon:yes stop_codon:yes gene_type:complete
MRKIPNLSQINMGCKFLFLWKRHKRGTLRGRILSFRSKNSLLDILDRVDMHWVGNPKTIA